MELRKLYLPPKSQSVAIESECGYLLVDSGKAALKITPIEADVTDFEQEKLETKDFGEISFL